MITREVTATLKDDTIRMSSKLFLYKNDGDICFLITLEGVQYTFDNGKEYVASCVIKKPNGELVFVDNLEITDGKKIHLHLEKEHVDDLAETGTHLCQLSLHSSASKTDRLTLPIFEIKVEKPLINL